MSRYGLAPWVTLSLTKNGKYLSTKPRDLQPMRPLISHDPTNRKDNAICNNKKTPSKIDCIIIIIVMIIMIMIIIMIIVVIIIMLKEYIFADRFSSLLR